MSNALSNIAINGNLNMDDILSVVSARAEKGFNTNLGEARTKVSNFEKAIKSKQAEIKKRTEEECLALVTDKANAARPGIETLGGTVTAISNGCGQEKQLRASIEIKRPGESYGNTLSFNMTGERSKVLVAMEDELADLQEKLNTATQEAMGWKKKLAGIPTLERQYKAKIAEAKLATSTDGQALLDLLTNDLEQSMLALPGF